MTYGYPPIYGTMRARIDYPETEADTHGGIVDLVLKDAMLCIFNCSTWLNRRHTKFLGPRRRGGVSRTQGDCTNILQPCIPTNR